MPLSCKLEAFYVTSGFLLIIIEQSNKNKVYRITFPSAILCIKKGIMWGKYLPEGKRKGWINYSRRRDRGATVIFF